MNDEEEVWRSNRAQRLGICYKQQGRTCDNKVAYVGLVVLSLVLSYNSNSVAYVGQLCHYTTDNITNDYVLWELPDGILNKDSREDRLSPHYRGPYRVVTSREG